MRKTVDVIRDSKREVKKNVSSIYLDVLGHNWLQEQLDESEGFQGCLSCSESICEVHKGETLLVVNLYSELGFSN